MSKDQYVTEIPSKTRDCHDWRMPRASWAEAYQTSWIPYKDTAKVIEKEVTAKVSNTDAGTFIVPLLTTQEVQRAMDKMARYVHYGIIQVGIDPLVRKWQDLPILIAVMDGSIDNFGRSLLGEQGLTYIQEHNFSRIPIGLKTETRITKGKGKLINKSLLPYLGPSLSTLHEVVSGNLSYPTIMLGV